MSKASRIAIGILAATLLLGLVACSRVTQHNYEQIKPGMTMEQVVTILGEPTSVETINLAGISGASATWKSGGSIITIQFFNHKVKIKALSKSGDNSRSSTEINLNGGSSN